MSLITRFFIHQNIHIYLLNNRTRKIIKIIVKNYLLCWAFLFDYISFCLIFVWKIQLKIVLFIFSRWLPKATTAMRPVGPADSSSSSYSDCILVVGVSRPKLAALFFSVMLISLFLTFHILYDSAVYSIQVSIPPFTIIMFIHLVTQCTHHPSIFEDVPCCCLWKFCKNYMFVNGIFNFYFHSIFQQQFCVVRVIIIGCHHYFGQQTINSDKPGAQCR